VPLDVTPNTITLDKVRIEQSVIDAREARKQELKTKIALGEELTNQELAELLAMLM